MFGETKQMVNRRLLLKNRTFSLLKEIQSLEASAIPSSAPLGYLNHLYSNQAVSLEMFQDLMHDDETIVCRVIFQDYTYIKTSLNSYGSNMTDSPINSWSKYDHTEWKAIGSPIGSYDLREEKTQKSSTTIAQEPLIQAPSPSICLL
jgi:hypothetical protein